jgi:transcriptional regulator with XRE-family HTH domain
MLIYMLSAADIRSTRKALGLTQPQFGQLLDVHWVTVSKWERDESQPTPYQVALIEKFAHAARREEVGRKVAQILITAGVIAALFLLLKAAMEER